MLVRNRFPREATAALRRFAWLFLILYGASSIALWALSVAGLGLVGPVTAYTVEISLTIALAFGGLYAAASALKPSNRDEVPAAR